MPPRRLRALVPGLCLLALACRSSRPGQALRSDEAVGLPLPTPTPPHLSNDHENAKALYNQLRPHFALKEDSATGAQVLQHKSLLGLRPEPSGMVLQAWIQGSALTVAILTPRRVSGPQVGVAFQAGSEHLSVAGVLEPSGQGDRIRFSALDGATTLRFLRDHPPGSIQMRVESPRPTKDILAPAHQAALVETLQLYEAMVTLAEETTAQAGLPASE